MSKPYSPNRTNRTPWTDILTLITVVSVTDADGYETKTETESDIFCTFSDGVNRAEFYEGYKNGLILSATVECWQSEYSGQKFCKHNNIRYKVIRAYETGRGTVELSLSEEVR